MNNTNDMSEEEEITETLQRTKKIIRGIRRNRDSSDSEIVKRDPSPIQVATVGGTALRGGQQITIILANDLVGRSRAHHQTAPANWEPRRRRAH